MTTAAQHSSSQVPGAVGTSRGGPTPAAAPPLFSNNQRPSVALPASGGSIRSISPSLRVNTVTATADLSIPLPLSESRPGPCSKPQLSLSYSSGNSNGICGYGWHLGLEAIHRKQSNKIPTYTDDDVFQLGGEDLVPRLDRLDTIRKGYRIRTFYRRTEAAYDRIERWVSTADPTDTFWKRITGDNITTVFGDSSTSRISDPADASKTLQWLVSASLDPAGNAVHYEYVEEDSVGVQTSALHESGRTPSTRSANRYLKTVSYGNREPCRSGDDFTAFHPRMLRPEDWMFRFVLDYGDHNSEQGWACRQDPFSSHSAGFEIRTYRLCHRMMMFHNFPNFVETDESGFLVNDLTFSYQSSPLGTTLQSATLTGHCPKVDADGNFTGNYESKAVPPLTFTYSQPSPPSDYVVQRADTATSGSAVISPASSGQWLDLYGTGVPGFLSKEDDVVFWRRNESPLVNTVRLCDPTAVAKVPNDGSPSRLPDLGDIDGSGRPALLIDPGYISQTDLGTWGEFRPFSQNVQLDPDHPLNTVQLDLTGDGLADKLFVADGEFLWAQSLGVDGYGPIQRTSFAGVQEARATLIFGYADQPFLHLADMSGDGLLDLVDVRNGRIEYFPNLGHGAFGTKVTMDHAPLFDHPDHYLSSSIRFIDVDGNGTQDVIYLSADGGADLYRNFSGNSFAAKERILGLPSLTASSRIDAVDLLGKGTGCLVWTSSLPGQEHKLQYIDLAPACKPHVLVSYENGLGLETFMEYIPSTKLFLEDCEAGREWATRLAFPVQCLYKVIKYDHVDQTKRTQRLRYRHGFWDVAEREFRGFGFVETWEGEDLDLPAAAKEWPVSSVAGTVSYTRSWFHIGLDMEQDKLTQHYQAEFCPSPKTSLAILPRPEDFSELATPELRGVYRTLIGRPIREEIYGLGPCEAMDIPYSITESTYDAVVVQASSTSPSPPVIRIDSEQNMTTVVDSEVKHPRTSHTVALSRDSWGNVLRSVTISYGLLEEALQPNLPQTVQEAQSKTSVVLTTKHYTNAVEEADDFLHPILCEEASYEVPLPANTMWGPSTLSTSLVSQWRTEEDVLVPNVNHQLLSKSRTTFRGNSFLELPVGTLDSMGITWATHKLVYPAYILDELYIDGSTSLLELSEALTGGYHDIDANGSLWARSEIQHFAPHGTSSRDELMAARKSFFTPVSFLDTFGAINSVRYDKDFLAIVESTDAVGNMTACSVDYRVLKPWAVTDINDNVTQMAFDVFGTPAATALVGKTSDKALNTLDDLVVDLTEQVISSFLREPTTTSAMGLLKGASSRVIYRLDASGVVQASITREQDSLLDEDGKLQIAITYLSGGGSEIQSKSLYAEDSTSATWLTSGLTIPDHRGNVVKEFVPFFDSTPLLNLEAGAEHVCTKVSVLDGLGRTVVVLGPNGLWSRTERGPWSTIARDAGDLVGEDVVTDPDVAESLKQLKVDSRSSMPWTSGVSEAAVKKSQIYRHTPHRTHVDPFGRPICTEVASQDSSKTIFTFTTMDILGRVTTVFDEMGRQVGHNQYDLAGRCCKQTLVDTGPSWSFFDAAGTAMITWNSRRAKIKTTYDDLRRPLAKVVTERPDTPPQTVERIVYGDDPDLGSSSPSDNNLKGKVYKLFDQAGVTQNEAFGPRGELCSSSWKPTLDYKGKVDWTDLSGPAVQPVLYRSSREFDALGRQCRFTAPDGMVQVFSYSQGGHLSMVSVAGTSEPGPEDLSSVVTETQYNARGQQILARFGNGVVTTHQYDELSFLCTSLKSVDAKGRVLQDLGYDHDCMGKIISIVDNAQQDAYFKNTVVSPRKEYTYDHIGRLLGATGREQIGRKADASPTLAARNKNLKLLVDGGTMSNYTESYAYDNAGNMLRMVHDSDVAGAGWTTNFTYAEPSLLEAGRTGNRLTSTTVGHSTENYGYGGDLGSEGCMTRMPGFSRVAYNFKDQMISSSRQIVSDGSTPETTYYMYNAAGQRVRKVTETAVSTADRDAGRSPVILRETRYLDGLDITTKYRSGSEEKQRSDLRISDGSTVLAVRETLVTNDTQSRPLLRYQLTGHLPSVIIELDHSGNVVSYEEYSPFGSTTLIATAAELGRGDVPSRKRYRFSGKERDKETGLLYFGRRYLCAAVARWTTADPMGLAADPGGLAPHGLNTWAYLGNDPVNHTDAMGLGPGDGTGDDDKKPSGGSSRVDQNAKAIAKKVDAVQKGLKSIAKGVKDIASDTKVEIVLFHFGRRALMNKLVEKFVGEDFVKKGGTRPIQSGLQIGFHAATKGANLGMDVVYKNPKSPRFSGVAVPLIVGGLAVVQGLASTTKPAVETIVRRGYQTGKEVMDIVIDASRPDAPDHGASGDNLPPLPGSTRSGPPGVGSLKAANPELFGQGHATDAKLMAQMAVVRHQSVRQQRRFGNAAGAAAPPPPGAMDKLAAVAMFAGVMFGVAKAINSQHRYFS